MSLGEFIPTSNTKLLLHLNGSSSDSSGLGNNGTDTNITYSQANGKFGQGAKFTSSSNSKITMPNYIVKGAKTVSLWLKHTQTSFFRYIDNIGVTNQNGFNIFHGGSSPNYEINFELFQSGNKVIDLKITSTIINDGNWHLITHTWDGTTNTNTAKLYLDGALKVQGTSSSTETNNPTRNLTLGEYNSSYDYDGSIDEVIIENRAWTAEEVKKYFTYSKGRFGII